MLSGGGRMGERMRAHDWAATPLGDPAGWPAALGTLVRVVLGSDQPMFIAWGPEHTLLYNDRYAPLLGRKDADALGRPLLDVWLEIRGDLEPLVERCLRGESIHSPDIVLMMERHGYREEAHFAFSYTPIVDADGAVCGIFCPCVETTGQVMAARSQLAERERLDRLFEQAPSFMAMLAGPDHVFELANPAFRRLVGGRDPVGLPVRRALPELEGQGFFEMLDGVYATAEPVDVTAHPVDLQRAADGPVERRYVDFVYQPMTDADGRVSGVFVEGFDVTDAVLAADALREAEGFNASLLEASSDCIVLLDLDGRILMVSPGGAAAMEVDDPQALHGRDWTDAWKGHGDVEAARAAVADARAGGIGRFQGFAPTLKGAPRWWDVAISAVGGEDGRPRRLVSVGRDVTERKRAEDALRALNADLERRVAERTGERNMLATLVESTDVMVLACDGDHRILAANRAMVEEFERAYGVRMRLGDDLLALLHDRPAERASVAAQWARGLAGEEFTVVHEFGDPARGRTHYEVKFSPLRDAAGRVVGAYHFVTDVGPRVRAEQELLDAQEALRQSQKLEAVGQLTGGVAHDFNNLLTVIRGSIDLLRRPNLADDRRARYMEAISETVDRASRLTAQLLAFARRQALKPEVFDAARNVEAVGEMLGTLVGARVEVVVDASAEPCFVDADPSQFDTAIVNMGVNARDAMGGEGRLAVTVRPVDQVPPIRSHPPVEGPHVAVSLSDTGGGIPAHVIDNIFEPFFTTKGVGQGTGLGLSQVFGFAKQSGGEVAVESEPGRGATFTLYLPRVSPPAGPRPREEAPEAQAGDDACVLLVEDNEDVGSFAGATLEELGFRTVLARDGQAALDLLAEDAQRFDVVFSDVVMPGMGGVELAREIGRRHPDLPVVLTSGYSDVLAAEGAHGLTLLGKPYSMDQLSSTLRRAQRRRG